MKARVLICVLANLLIGFLLLPPGIISVANTPTGHSHGASLAEREPLLRMRIGTFDPLKSMPFGAQSVHTGAALHLIQFPGPIQDLWYTGLVDTGLDVVLYIPDYSYLVWGTGEQLRRVGKTVPVRWAGAYDPAYALHPDLLTSARLAPEDHDGQGCRAQILVQLYRHTDAEEVLAQVLARAEEILRPPMQIQNTIVVGLQVPHNRIPGLASLPGVISVEPLSMPERFDEVQGQLVAGNLNAAGSQPAAPGYLHWLTSTVGLPTASSAYPIIDIVDDGIDDGQNPPLHPDFYELGDVRRPPRLVYNANWTSDAVADSGGGHGNLNASIAGGYNARMGPAFRDEKGYSYGLGINPFGRIAGSKVFSNDGYWAFPNLQDLVAHSYRQGARILSNSWGESRGSGQYGLDDRLYDILVRDAIAGKPGSQPLTILFAAGNGGPETRTISSPGNAKNVITVGASESYRPTWMDGCMIGKADADNASEISSFSSRGPTADGRIKPDLVAPGTHIIGAASQASTYTGLSICDPYYPAGQTLYAASSGTSHATPAVAGAVSLLTRYYQDRFGTYPSPAMLKAYLINSARYLDGVEMAETLPSNHQGFGAVNLGMAFDMTPRLVRDQTTLFRDSGDSTVIAGTIADTDRPVRVTLAWTDAPGATVGASYVNNLDLVVTVEGKSYRGNVFSGAYSRLGGTADTRNNVESVFLPSGLTGEITLTVIATNIAGDGVPGNGDPTDQDFALVCYNCQDLSWSSVIYLPLLYRTPSHVQW
jgi:hypothetical protein